MKFIQIIINQTTAPLGNTAFKGLEELISNKNKKFKHEPIQIKFKGTASILLNEIVLTGVGIDGLYNYNSQKNAYEKILILQGSYYKYSMNNWILSSEKRMYANIEKSLYLFQYYNLNIEVYFPLGVSFCLHNNYVYFIDGSNKLIRIDDAQKKLEIVSFSSINKIITMSFNSQACIQLENKIMKK